MALRHKSAIKAARQSEKRRQRNRAVLTSVKGVVKKLMSAVEEKDAEGAKSHLREATSALRKAVTKGVVKPNTASRRTSRLAHRVNALTSAQT